MTDSPKCKRQLGVLLTRFITALAESQLACIPGMKERREIIRMFFFLIFSLKIFPDDAVTDGELSPFTLLRMLSTPMQQGKLESAVENVFQLLPTLKGVSQRKALIAAGMVLFCLQVRFLLVEISELFDHSDFLARDGKIVS